MTTASDSLPKYYPRPRCRRRPSLHRHQSRPCCISHDSQLMRSIEMQKFLSLTVSLALAAMPVFAAQSAGNSQDVESQAPKFALEDGTPVKLVLGETISSADAVVGQLVSFEVVEDIIVDGVVVVPKGGTAWATVTAAEHKKRMGRGGKLDLNVDKVRLADGSKTLLSAVKNTKGGGHTGAMTGAIVVTSLILWPAAPFFLFMHGKDITIPKGTALTAFVQGDDVLDRPRFIRLAHPVIPPSTATTSSGDQIPLQKAAAQQEPAMQFQSVDPQSLGEVARQNRARKAKQDPPPQDKPQNQ